MRNLRGLALKEWAQTWMLVSCLLVLTSQLVPHAYAQSHDASQPQRNPEITLSGSEYSREGYFQLAVEGLSDDQPFVIQQASNTDFDPIEASFPPLGSFRQISLSGFDDGTYYFRARVEQGDGSVSYSNTHISTVQHYALWQALGLFALGGVLFITLVTTLLRLHRGSQRAQVSKDNEGAHG